MALNFKQIEQVLNEKRIFYKTNEPMKNYTSFKIGGVCKFLTFPENFKKVKFLIEFCKCNSIKHFFLGNGTNVLFSDSCYEGIGIVSKMLNKIKLLSDDEIYCESGVPLIKLVDLRFFIHFQVWSLLLAFLVV